MNSLYFFFFYFFFLYRQALNFREHSAWPKQEKSFQLVHSVSVSLSLSLSLPLSRTLVALRLLIFWFCVRCQEPYKRRPPCKLNELGLVMVGFISYSWRGLPKCFLQNPSFFSCFLQKPSFFPSFILSIYKLSLSLDIFHVQECFITCVWQTVFKTHLSFCLLFLVSTNSLSLSTFFMNRNAL
jgi:hypothetical protein